MERSERNFLEKIADWIPGLKGYRAREDRRETDKRLRDYLATRLDVAQDRVDEIKLDLTNRGNLAALQDVGQLHRKLQRITDTMRFATYGYSGFFDQLKIKEDELDVIYQHDLQIMGQVEALEAALADPERPVELGMEAVKALDEALVARKTLFDQP
jgi:hypothetical protein